MYKINLFARKIFYFICLTSMYCTDCWVVKIINVTDENITVDINSTQLYPGWSAGKLVKRACEFIGKQVDAHASQDFNYKDVNPICIAPCTKSITITSPVQLTVKNTLTSCSNVIALVRRDASNNWSIEYHDWTADILKLLEERTRMPAAVRDIFDQFGDSPIQALSVFRQPIQAGIRELAKIITKNELKHLHYDEVYHTGFIITCRDQFIKLERNQTITSTIIKPEDAKASEQREQRDIVLPRTIRYNEFISNAMANDPNFWRYNPVTNNCQLFVLQCLEKNKIAVSPELHAFIYQDAGKILANSPLVKNIAIGATSLANRIDKILEGTSDITIQNATPYTIRVQTRYAGSTLFKSCLADDFLLASGSEKTVSHGFCLLEGIKVAASLQGADTIFAESSFVGQGKARASFLIRSGKGKKITIENIGNQRLSTAELQKLAAAAK